MAAESKPLVSLDQLLEPFHQSEKPRARWKIGTEAEKCGIYQDGSPVPFLGERGVRLSGGQRQRIALARAILRKPEILILDESTSQIDMASELQIRETLQSMKGQMTIIITYLFQVCLRPGLHGPELREPLLPLQPVSLRQRGKVHRDRQLLLQVHLP